MAKAKITEFNWQDAPAFEKDLVGALAKFGQEHGLSFTVKTKSMYPTASYLEITANIVGADSKRELWNKHAESLGLKLEWLDKMCRLKTRRANNISDGMTDARIVGLGYSSKNELCVVILPCRDRVILPDEARNQQLFVPKAVIDGVAKREDLFARFAANAAAKAAAAETIKK
jgi:hypothetical protein